MTISFDFGDPLKSLGDVGISVNLDTTLGEMWQLPEVREVIAESIEPILRHLNLSEKGIEREKERILLSGRLFKEVSFPYRYDTRNHRIISDRDDETNKKYYPVSDYLEGRLPGLPKTKSGLDYNSSEHTQ